MSIFQAKAYLSHWLQVVDEHSIHSPFFFDFHNRVIKGKSVENDFAAIEKTREKLLNDHHEIELTDLGAKSPHFTGEKRKLSRIAETSLSPAHLCLFLNRLGNYMEAGRIVELGTSMGITTLYLAKVPTSTVYTFEGNNAMNNIALTNFEYFETKNIHLVEGNIDQTLPDFLQSTAKIDLAIIDANHRYEPTLRYFNQLSRRMSDHGIIMVDDIHYSQEMENAWKALLQHDLVYGSVDLFRCGLLFFDLALNKQHYVWSL